HDAALDRLRDGHLRWRRRALPILSAVVAAGGEREKHDHRDSKPDKASGAHGKMPVKADVHNATVADREISNMNGINRRPAARAGLGSLHGPGPVVLASPGPEGRS